MRHVKAATNHLLKLANNLDRNGLMSDADVLHRVLRRMANDEMFNFGDGAGEEYPKDDTWQPPTEESQPTMKELERVDFERELFDLVMKKTRSPEGLSQEEHERMQQIMHYLKGNSWDGYRGDPENERLRSILQDPSPGFMSESIDSDSEHEY